MKQLAISHQIRKLTYNPIVTSKKVKKIISKGWRFQEEQCIF